VDSAGRVSYTCFRREEETLNPVEVNFDSLLPYAVIRNAIVEDVGMFSMQENALKCIVGLFYQAAVEGLHPVAFLVGSKSVLPDWYRISTGLPIIAGSLFGYPIYADNDVPSEVLLLSTSYHEGGGLPDVHKSYKALISGEPPALVAPPSAFVPNADDTAFVVGIPRDDQVHVEDSPK
jgi:hypothetical protein